MCNRITDSSYRISTEKVDKEMKWYFQWTLWLISFIVALGLVFKQNMWIWITAYWTILSIKNLYDLWRTK